MDRPLVIAFCFSLACHLVLLGVQLIRLPWHSLMTDRRTLDVIYEYEIAQEDLRRLQRQLEELHDQAKQSLPDISAPSPHIRIPDRPTAGLPAEGTAPPLGAPGLSASLPPLATGASTSRAAVVDLANLVDATHGDPVLLSYFSAIREQIQQTANHQVWLTGEAATGLVYVSFVLTSTGDVRSTTVLADRSIPSRTLQDIALKIIKAASPFAPFPPSIAEPTKTVVVPLEFLVGF